MEESRIDLVLRGAIQRTLIASCRTRSGADAARLGGGAPRQRRGCAPSGTRRRARAARLRLQGAPAARQPNGWAVEHRGSAEAALHQGLDDEPPRCAAAATESMRPLRRGCCAAGRWSSEAALRLRSIRDSTTSSMLRGCGNREHEALRRGSQTAEPWSTEAAQRLRSIKGSTTSPARRGCGNREHEAPAARLRQPSGMRPCGAAAKRPDGGAARQRRGCAP